MPVCHVLRQSICCCLRYPILNIDISKHILPSTFRYDNVQEWTDANMRWNTSEYSDIKDIRLPPARLWKPDILMYNRSVLCALHSTSPDMQAVFDNLR